MPLEQLYIFISINRIWAIKEDQLKLNEIDSEFKIYIDKVLFENLRIRQYNCKQYSLNYAVITDNFNCKSNTCVIRAEIKNNIQENTFLI